MIWDITVLHGFSGERRRLVGSFPCPCILKGEWYLLFAPPWKLPGQDMDPTQRIQLLVGLPHRSRSNSQSLAHLFDVIGDRRISGSQLP